ncbi:MAG: hypothetical protein WA003_13935, partial [Desulfuromonadaceae bacterium]
MKSTPGSTSSATASNESTIAEDSAQDPPWDSRASARIHELEMQVQDALRLQESLGERLKFENMLSEI